MLLLALLHAGCDATALDSGDSQGRDSARVTDDECRCGDGDCAATATWTTDGICFAVAAAANDQRFYFGMAETGSGEGWYGEDCIDGPGPNSGDYDICHSIMGCEQLCLDTVRDPDDVVPSKTTLFNDTIASAGNITYMLGDGTDCWTTGNDTSYYTSSLGCAAY